MSSVVAVVCEDTEGNRALAKLCRTLLEDLLTMESILYCCDLLYLAAGASHTEKEKA